MRYTNRWTLPEVTFYQVEDHGFTDYGDRPLYGYERVTDPGQSGKPKLGELYTSLDRALIAWVGEKYTGPRGAGGSGVGTAADWFARMIGMDALTPVGYQDGQKALIEILADTGGRTAMRQAQLIESELSKRDLTLAAKVHP